LAQDKQWTIDNLSAGAQGQSFDCAQEQWAIGKIRPDDKSYGTLKSATQGTMPSALLLATQKI